MYSNRGGRYEVWRMRPEGTDLHLFCDTPASDPTWSPAGDRVVASVDHGDRWNSTGFFGPDPEASDPLAPWTAVREEITDFSPGGWSPDGRYLAGTSPWPWSIRVYDLEADAFVETDPFPVGDRYTMTWMPDSRRVLVWNEERQRFVTWDFRTGAVEPVAGLGSTPGSAKVSPDGRVLYVLEDNVDGDIWMLTLAGPGEAPGDS
jgi:WD40 repeat protein